MVWLAVTLRWLQRRTRYFVILVVLGAMSSLLLAVAHYSDSSFAQNLYIDLGAGFIAVIATFFVLNPLFEQIRTANTQEHPKLDQARYIAHVADSRKIVRILETWIPLLNIELRRKEFLRAVTGALKSGAKIEILLLNPDSRAAEQRTDELQGENAHKAIMENLYYLHRYRTDSTIEKTLSVRIYSGLPPVQLYQWDDKAFISFFPLGKHSEQSPQLETSIVTPWGDFVKRKFEELWNDSGTQELQQYRSIRLIVNSDKETQLLDVDFVLLEGCYYVSDRSMLEQIAMPGIENIRVSLEAPLQDGEELTSYTVEILGSEEQDVLQRLLDLFQVKYGSNMYSERDVIVRLVPPGETLQEHIRYHEDPQQRVAAIEDGLALLTSGDLDHPDRDSAWH